MKFNQINYSNNNDNQNSFIINKKVIDDIDKQRNIEDVIDNYNLQTYENGLIKNTEYNEFIDQNTRKAMIDKLNSLKKNGQTLITADEEANLLNEASISWQKDEDTLSVISEDSEFSNDDNLSVSSVDSQNIVIENTNFKKNNNTLNTNSEDSGFSNDDNLSLSSEDSQNIVIENTNSKIPQKNLEKNVSTVDSVSKNPGNQERSSGQKIQNGMERLESLISYYDGILNDQNSSDEQKSDAKDSLEKLNKIDKSKNNDEIDKEIDKIYYTNTEKQNTSPELNEDFSKRYEDLKNLDNLKEQYKSILDNEQNTKEDKENAKKILDKLEKIDLSNTEIDIKSQADKILDENLKEIKERNNQKEDPLKKSQNEEKTINQAIFKQSQNNTNINDQNNTINAGQANTIQNNTNNQNLPNDDKLKNKFLGKSTFKELQDNDEYKKINKDKNHKINVVKENDKLTFYVDSDISLKSRKILESKVGKDGYVVKDRDGSSASINVTRKNNGNTDYKLIGDQNSGKKPFLTLGKSGAFVELGDDNETPVIYCKDKKEFEKLKEKYKGVTLNGQTFEDLGYEPISQFKNDIKMNFQNTGQSTGANTQTNTVLNTQSNTVQNTGANTQANTVLNTQSNTEQNTKSEDQKRAEEEAQKISISFKDIKVEDTKQNIDNTTNGPSNTPNAKNNNSSKDIHWF